MPVRYLSASSQRLHAPLGTIGEADYHRALATLSQFKHVTSLELSAHRDAAALAFAAPPLFWASTAPRNRSGGHHSNHHAAHAMSAAQRATLARLNQWDLCLYRHVRQ